MLRALGFAAVLSLASICIGNAVAEPLPLPAVDYEARGEILNGGKMLVRHSKGRMRIEFAPPGVNEKVIGILDLNAKKMFMILPIPGLGANAIEIDISDFDGEGTFGQVIGNGERIGNATVAGEACTLWRVSGKNEKESAVACLSRDNIPLRTQAVIEGKERTIFEVSEVKRTPQNSSEFELPRDVKVMKLPKGLKNIPGMNFR